ncbi:MAG: MFS transporter [Phycisphaerae bacterium]
MEEILTKPVISPYDDRRYRSKTMRLSVIEGAFAVITIGLQEAFYVPYLNFLGASKIQIGIGAALPALVMGLSQLWIPLLLVRAKRYKPIVAISTLIHALCFIPLGLVIYMSGPAPVWSAISAVVVASIAFGCGMAAWADWMSHIVPRRRRGKYFGIRNRLLTVIQLAFVVISGQMLDHIVSKAALIFAMIWFISSAARIVSAIGLMLQYEPAQIHAHPRHSGNFVQFLKSNISGPLGTYGIAMAMLSFAANFAAPFFAVYMLNDLKWSYLQYTLVHITPPLVIILTIGLLGKLCDRLGNVLPMRLFALCAALNPVLWLVTHNHLLLLCNQVLAGIGWGGLALASFNYTIHTIDRRYRVAYIAYLNVINYTGVALGAFLGGLIGPMLPVILDYQLQSVFAVSAAMRLCAVLLFKMIPADKPAHYKMNAAERFFFDPKLSLKVGLARTVMSILRRPL